MKRIEYLAPVAAMRGNLGETQRDIVYPTHDNSAYDGPEGELNTARNYQPIIVGAKRASGRAYFCVRTKTSNHLTPKAKKAMASMGASCAIYAAMKKDAFIASLMDDAFEFVKSSLPANATMRSFFMEAISLALRNKEAEITIYAGEYGFSVNNPFVTGGTSEYNVTISNEILVKFWEQLANNPIIFTVDGAKGVAHDDDTFGDVIASQYNVLELKTGTVDPGMGNLMIGDMYVCYDYGEYIGGLTDAVFINDGDKYILTPEPHEDGG